MVSEKFKLLVGKVKTILSNIKPEDIANFALKEAAGSIPVVGQYIKDAIDEFSPDEKLELLQELKEISQSQFTELSKEIGVSVEYLKDIKTFTYDACAIQKADHEEIKGLLYRIINQTKFEIEKQEPHRDLYNVAGNLIINPITHEPVYIPSIQSVLRKGVTSEGDFFKKEPEWVDYEQGFIVKRKEVDEIINKLSINKVQLVLGAPASGKSIILKNVGYKLANDGKKVYVVELKKHPQDEIRLFFENIPKIEDDSPIFIVDDAHLYLSECERLIRNFKGRGRGRGKLIIGSRVTKEITEGDPTKASEFEHLSKTAIHIQAEDVTEEIIQTFLKRQYNLDEDRFRTASIKHENFKKDLWYLSWALKVYDSDNYSFDENKIYKNIKKRIEQINAENVFLPLSVFFRYEIPIERKFLEKQLGIQESIIDDLIGLQEIVEIEELRKPTMLSLHHSSIADLYFRTYQNYPSFGEKIKEKILYKKDEKDLYFAFYQYLTTYPGNSVDVVISLNSFFSEEKGGFILLRKLIGQNEIQKSIKNGINNEEDIEKIMWCASVIALINFEAAIKLVESVSAKTDILNDIEKVGRCFLGYKHVIVNQIALKLADSIDIHSLYSKIDKEQDIGKIGVCVSGIAQASLEAVNKLVERIDIHALSSKINKEHDIGKVGYCVSCIACVNKEVAMKLVESIDIHVLSSKLNKENDILKIGECVSGIAWANKEVAMKFLERIDIHTLSSKIINEQDIGKVGVCVFKIAQAKKEVAMKLVESVQIKIDKEEDIEKVGRCLSRIAGASEEVAMKLVDSFSTRIDKEEDIEKVGLCVKGIAEANKEVGLKLANSIDSIALASKINKEEDIEKVGLCVEGIGKANKEVGLKLANSIDSTALASKKIKKRILKRLGCYSKGKQRSGTKTG